MSLSKPAYDAHGAMTNNEAAALINKMTHIELARAWRFEPMGSALFRGEAGRRFSERLFNEFGGFTPEISKEIGWDAK